MSTVSQLEQRGLITPPRWLSSNLHFETIAGSIAYGVSDSTSDFDIYGFCVPPKEIVFPHLAGEIFGFGKQIQRFEQWQQHRVWDADAQGGAGRNYDTSIYNIVKYFQLCMDNNPNMLDSLFTPINCVLHSTEVGNMVRDKRKLFLHKGCWPKFKGYAYSQLHKMAVKDPIGKRKETREKFGMDVKFAYNIVRLLDECEQILIEGDLDLQRPKEQLKSIRRGEWTEEQIREWFTKRERELAKVYNESKLRWGPDEPAIKQLLLDCLEHHYGSLEKCVVNPDEAVQALREVAEALDRNRHLL